MSRVLTITDPEGRYTIAEGLSTSDEPEAYERDVAFVGELAKVIRKDCIWQVVEAANVRDVPGLEAHAALCVHCGLVIVYERAAHANGGDSGWVHKRSGEYRGHGGHGAEPPASYYQQKARAAS